MTFPVPSLVRIEYWNPMLQEWAVGHAGINLLNPAAYIQKLAERGTVARAVDTSTGEIIYTDGGDLL